MFRFIYVLKSAATMNFLQCFKVTERPVLRWKRGLAITIFSAILSSRYNGVLQYTVHISVSLHHYLPCDAKR